MLTFPKLSGGAVLQYPFTRELVCETRVLRFLDGTEQRIPKTAPRRRWIVRYADITEDEGIRIAVFLLDYLASNTPFEFTDPATGITHPSCRIEADHLSLSTHSAFRTQTSLTIVEDND